HQQMDAPVVGSNHLELLRADDHRLPATRHMPKVVGHQAADGVELIVAELGAEMGIELVDGRKGLDQAVAVLVLQDVAVLVEVMLVVDLADDLLDHVLHGHEPRQAAVLRSEEHTSELQSRENLVCRLLLEKKKYKTHNRN